MFRTFDKYCTGKLVLPEKKLLVKYLFLKENKWLKPTELKFFLSKIALKRLLNNKNYIFIQKLTTSNGIFQKCVL